MEKRRAFRKQGNSWSKSMLFFVNFAKSRADFSKKLPARALPDPTFGWKPCATGGVRKRVNFSGNFWKIPSATVKKVKITCQLQCILDGRFFVKKAWNPWNPAKVAAAAVYKLRLHAVFVKNQEIPESFHENVNFRVPQEGLLIGVSWFSWI